MVIDLLKLFHLWITYFVKSWGSTSRTTLYFILWSNLRSWSCLALWLQIPKQGALKNYKESIKYFLLKSKGN